MSVEQEQLAKSIQKLSLKEKIKSMPDFMIGNKKLEINSDEPNEELKEKARIELRETPEIVEEAFKVFRQLLEGEPNLKVPTDNDFLKKFLRPCKWYPDSSFEMIKRYYKFRQNYPHFCQNLYPSNERALLMSGVLTPLPIRSNNVRIILLESGKKWKPKEVSINQMFRGFVLFLEAALVEEVSQIAGVRVILNMDGLTMSQVTHYTPSFAFAVVDFVQRCLPCRLKGVHVLNQPYIFNMVFAIFKPFLQEKLRKRIHFHGTDMESLHNFIDPEALPTKFGGTLDFPEKPIGEPMIKFLSVFDNDFIESGNYGYDSKS